MTMRTRLARTSLLGRKANALIAMRLLRCVIVNKQLDNGEVSGEVNGLATE